MKIMLRRMFQLGSYAEVVVDSPSELAEAYRALADIERYIAAEVQRLKEEGTS